MVCIVVYGCSPDLSDSKGIEMDRSCRRFMFFSH